MMPLLQVAIILLVTAIAGLYASCRRAATGGAATRCDARYTPFLLPPRAQLIAAGILGVK